MNIIEYTQNMVKDITQLPPHITFNQYKKLKESVPLFYKDKLTRKRQKIIERDILLLTYLWETGGRIRDVLNIKYNMFRERDLYLYNQKRKKTIVVTFTGTSRLIEDTLIYMKKYYIDNDERLFKMTVQNAWKRIKDYSKNINFPSEIKVWKNGKSVTATLRPHLFRHGLAIYLLSQGVAIPVISAILGHASVYTTMKIYLKVTPDIQREAIKDIEMR